MSEKMYAVIGAGSFGVSVARGLYNKGCDVMLIDRDETVVHNMAESVTYAVCLDAKDEAALISVGIRDYHTAVVCIGESITDSVLATMFLKEQGVKRVVCKALNPEHKRLLEKVGADRVIIPEYEMGERLASGLVNDNMIDYMILSDEYSLAEIVAPKRWFGKTMIELDIRCKYGVSVIGFRENGRINISPDPSRKFKQGDIIIAAGDNTSLERITKL